MSVSPSRRSPIRLAVIHEALDAGDRRALHHEERKGHLDVPGVGLQPLGHLLEHGAEGVDRDLPLVLCRISTKRDMCVPLKSWGRFTYMLKVAMVCCSPAVRSLTRTG